MGLTEVVDAVFAYVSSETGSSSSRTQASFQWGGTIFAILLLILNRTVGQRSPMQTNLLVLYLLTSFPTLLFKIVRGQFGYWLAFLAVSANLYFPQTFPVSRYLLLVITPDWITNGLRDNVVGCIFCLIIIVSLIIVKIRDIGGISNCECNCHCLGFCISIVFLVFFTVLGFW